MYEKFNDAPKARLAIANNDLFSIVHRRCNVDDEAGIESGFAQ